MFKFNTLIYMCLCAAFCYGERDTTLEVADAEQLDLKTHQLYIDTSKSSQYYGWVEKGGAAAHKGGSARKISIKGDKKKIHLTGFSRFWVTIRKYKGQYYLYDRCDGSDRTYAIKDSAVDIFGPLEGESLPINKMVKNTKTEMALDVTSYMDPHAILSIERTDVDDVYRLRLNGGESTVAPIRSIRKFAVVVNHCPTGKVSEFLYKFD